ncbi:MAG: peptidoglycan DD-metalloendopeptidase family protein [Candidatus Aenigmarchaeota archaeon]|nr:peptidoglycan DD-metalloendopeptidase family protein [Candidatus Aenigmarchaeota archaeon]MDW8149816.1 peptidoglycan DD-metalloendopeptidase family protein [Candidatus Aenigmarchaeota archaeon]
MKEIQEKKNIQRRIKLEKTKIQDELKKLDKKVKEKEKAIKNLNLKISEIFKKIKLVNTKIHGVEQTLDDEKLKYKKLAIYGTFTALTYKDAMIDALIISAAKTQKEKLLEIASTLNTLQIEMEELKKLKFELDKTLLDLHAEEKELKKIKEERSNLLKNKLAMEVAIEMELKELENRKKELDDLITKLKLKRKYEGIRDEIASLKGKFIMPVNGTVIERFGRKKHETLDVYIFNPGIRIKPNENHVKSIYDGVVIYAGKFRDYGNMVIVEHSFDLISIYAGLDTITVSENMNLKKGSIIGNVSDVLYFELRIGGKPHDPLEWF